MPLDPKLPEEQLRLRVATAGIHTVISEQAMQTLAGSLGATTSVLLEDAEPAAERAAISSDEFAPAYLLFTSGSTGTPKGVLQFQRAVLHHAETYANSIRLTPGDRVVQFANYAFDASVMDIFGALFTGACLLPVDLREDTAAETAADWLADKAVSVLHSTPTVYRFLFERYLTDSTLPPLPALRAVVLGGEEARAEDLDVFTRISPEDAVFVNGLGPSESTMALQFFADHRTKLKGQKLPVGRPVADTAIVLKDRSGAESSICGELCIVSSWVSPGYWDTTTGLSGFDAATLAEPRRYESGDHARYLPDGQLLFAGRQDDQIKLRGYRIELGEIESCLLTLPGVRQAAARLFNADPGNPRLIGYAVTDDSDPAAETLLAGLKEQLPAYMVPAGIMLLEELPKTATGKVQRSALPEPDLSALSGSGFAEPRTPVEQVLCECFSAVLQVERVGIYDDFFALGGHSLLATRLVTRIRETLEKDVPLRLIFDHPNVAGLAGALDDLDETGSGLPALLPASRNKPLPMSFSQQRLWFLDKLAPGGHNYNISWGIEIHAPLNAAALQAALDALVKRHEILRTTFADSDDGPVQVIHDSISLAPNRIDTNRADTARFNDLVDGLLNEGFDLNAGPLFRLHWLRLAEDEHILIVMMHHIISDAWSINVVNRDLQVLYEAASSGNPAALPELDVQYADYANWQRHWLSGKELERQLGYWQDQLAGAPALLELPTDRPRPPVQTFNGASLYFQLDAAVSGELQQLARGNNATLFMVLLAAFNTLLYRYTGQEDIVHPASSVDQGRGQNGQRTTFFQFPCRTEKGLGVLQRVGIQAASHGAAGLIAFRVPGSGKSRYGIEKDNDVASCFDQSFGFFDDHFRNGDVTRSMLIKGGTDYFAIRSLDFPFHVGDFFRALINQQHHDVGLRKICQNGAGHFLEQNGLARSRRTDDQAPLPKADGRHQVNDPC